MKFKYRPNREFLDQAMLEVQEFNNVEDLKKYLNLEERDKLEFIYQGYDKRIGWVSFLVCVNGEARGHSNGCFQNASKDY